jgi:hypothetical protein
MHARIHQTTGTTYDLSVRRTPSPISFLVFSYHCFLVKASHFPYTYGREEMKDLPQLALFVVHLASSPCRTFRSFSSTPCKLLIICMSQWQYLETSCCSSLLQPWWSGTLLSSPPSSALDRRKSPCRSHLSLHLRPQGCPPVHHTNMRSRRPQLGLRDPPQATGDSLKLAVYNAANRATSSSSHQSPLPQWPISPLLVAQANQS